MNTSLLVRIGTITINTFLPMRNMFVYFCSVTNPCFRIWQTLGKHFLPPAGCGSVFPAKSCWNAWRWVSQLARGWWIWQMRQNLIARSVQLLKHLLCDMQSSIAMGKNWALSVDQCWLQVWQLLVHVINFLNMLLRCNGFATIQKAIVDQMGSRPPNSDHDLFFGTSLAWGSALELLSPIIVDCHHMSLSDQEMLFYCSVE